MSAISLLDLPMEVQTMVIEHIIRPSDLKALCLTCHSISDLAIPRLYRTLDLHYLSTDPKWTRIQSLFDNPHLMHVRNLHLAQQLFEIDQEHLLLKELIGHLHRNTVRNIEVRDEGCLDKELEMTFWESQQCLTTVSLRTPEWLGQESRHPFGETVRALCPLASMKSMDLRVHSTTIEELADRLPDLPQYASLQELTFELRRDHWDWEESDSDDGMDTFDRDLISSYLPRTLRKMNLTFELPRSSVLQLDSWSSLTDLTLSRCANIGPTLAHYRSPRLSSLVIRDYFFPSRRAEEGRLIDLASLLGRFKSLETLILDFAYLQKDPSAVERLAHSLVSHTGTLKALVFRCGSMKRDEHTTTLKILLSMVAQCSKLEEFGLWLRSDWIVDTCTEILKTRKNLSILNLMWPSQPYDWEWDIPYDWDWEPNLYQDFSKIVHQDLVGKIFATTHSDWRVPVITFGQIEYKDDLLGQPIIFRESFVRQDHTGTLEAVPITDGALGYRFPNSKILEYRAAESHY